MTLFCINITFTWQVTSEQADYARGFEDALNEIRTKEQQHQQTTAQPQQQNGSTKFTSGAYWTLKTSHSFAKYYLLDYNGYVLFAFNKFSHDTDNLSHHINNIKYERWISYIHGFR